MDSDVGFPGTLMDFFSKSSNPFFAFFFYYYFARIFYIFKFFFV